MSEELYKEYRPTIFREVVGQGEGVNTIKTLLASEGGLPHTLLLSGPSGVGKTTLARIIAAKLQCDPKLDLIEMNAAECRGIDAIRNIADTYHAGALGGPCRVWIIDEAHALTKDAQNAFLKPLEDTPAHVYFILCTTDPSKLIKTVLSRCTEIKLKEVSKTDIKTIVTTVMEKTGITLDDQEVLDKLVEVAEGCPRKALVILNQIRNIVGTEAQLAAIARGDSRVAGFELARALYNAKPGDWGSVAAVLKKIEWEKEDVEGLRHMMLSYATTILMSGKMSQRAFIIIECFKKNFYDSKRPGLVGACYDVVTAK